MKRLLEGTALILCLGILTSSCRVGHSSTAELKGTPELVLRGEKAMRERFGHQVEHLLLTDQYASLDSMADALRQSQEKWPDGRWKLRTFYNYGFDISLRNATEADWQKHLTHLRQWNAASAGSITAPVALAYALSSYAWVARGDQAGREVSDEGAHSMRERLEQARKVLIAARDLPRVCPGWWMTAQKIGIGESWSREVSEELFREAVRNEPTFESYYEFRARYLLPRWYGKEGEWERYADSISNLLPPPDGDQRYARIVWSVQQYIGNNVFEETQASWDRTKAGFEQLVKAHPASLELRSAFAYLAHRAADQPTARAQFLELGTRIDPGVWEDRTEFMEARKWSFTE